MSTVPVALRCADYQKHVVVFRQDSFDTHKLKHPELEQPGFFPEPVKKALRKPTFCIAGHKNNATCYYLELFAKNGIMRYVKVVVSNRPENINSEQVYRIKTAFKTDHIQEKKYGYALQYI
jgi:hypothetical protein